MATVENLIGSALKTQIEIGRDDVFAGHLKSGEVLKTFSCRKTYGKHGRNRNMLVCPVFYLEKS